MSGSEDANGQKYDVGLVHDPIGVWVERTVVDERYERSWTYPKTLMSEGRIRIASVTVLVSYERPGKPEAATRARRAFEQITDAVEDLILRRDLGAVFNDDETHNNSPSDSGQVLSTPDATQRTVGETGDTVVPSEAVSPTTIAENIRWWLGRKKLSLAGLATGRYYRDLRARVFGGGPFDATELDEISVWLNVPIQHLYRLPRDRPETLVGERAS